MNAAQKLELYRAAIAAKAAYWDANCALEKALCGDEIDDGDADTIHEDLENMAVGLDSPSDVKWVTKVHLKQLVEQLG